jgi:hypothetical protein
VRERAGLDWLCEEYERGDVGSRFSQEHEKTLNLEGD